jgi:hypothetical protein
MKHALAVLSTLWFCGSALAGEVTLNGHTFTIPDGFEI